MGRVSYSYADAMISISPFNFVLADSDTLNSSKNEINKKMHYFKISVTYFTGVSK